MASLPAFPPLADAAKDKGREAKDFLAGFFAGAKDRALSIGRGTSMRDQLLAALLLPFTIVASFMFAVVLKGVLLDLMPDNLGSLSAVVFLLGTALLIAALGFNFAWVKTGGFGLFA